MKIGGWTPSGVSRRFFPQLLAFFAHFLRYAGPQTQSSGTASFIFDGNRMYASLALVRPDGTLRKILAFVDLGSPTTVLSDALYKELLLDPQKPLTFMVGDMPVRVDSTAVSHDSWFPYDLGEKGSVEMLLPAGVIQNHQVVIDYAHRTLTLAQPTHLPSWIRRLIGPSQ